MKINESLFDEVNPDEVNDTEENEFDTSGMLMLNIHMLKRSKKEVPPRVLRGFNEVMYNISMLFSLDVDFDNMKRAPIEIYYKNGDSLLTTDSYDKRDFPYTRDKTKCRLDNYSFFTIRYDYLKINFSNVASISKFLIKLFVRLQCVTNNVYDITFRTYDNRFDKKDIFLFTLNPIAFYQIASDYDYYRRVVFPKCTTSLYKMLLGWSASKIPDEDANDQINYTNIINYMISSNIASNFVRFNLLNTINKDNIVKCRSMNLNESKDYCIELDINGIEIKNIMNKNGDIFPLWFTNIMKMYRCEGFVKVGLLSLSYEKGDIFMNGELNPRIKISYINSQDIGKTFFFDIGDNNTAYNILRLSDYTLLSKKWFNSLHYCQNSGLFVVECGMGLSNAYMTKDGKIVNNKWFKNITDFNLAGYAVVSICKDEYYIIDKNLKRMSQNYYSITNLVSSYSYDKNANEPMFKVVRASDKKTNFLMNDFSLKNEEWT